MINEKQPLNINILLTGICNLKCPECFAIDHINNISMQKMMNSEDYQYILNLAEKEQIQHINLIGGEPSLHPKAIQFIQQALNKGFKVNFSTNMLWSEKFLKEINPFIKQISFKVTFHGQPKYSKENWKK